MEKELLYAKPYAEFIPSRSRDQAIKEELEDYLYATDELPDTFTLVRYERMTIKPSEISPLEDVLQQLDEEYGNPEVDYTEPTESMLRAEREFAEAILSEYKPFMCKHVEEELIDVKAWLKEHPDYKTTPKSEIEKIKRFVRTPQG